MRLARRLNFAISLGICVVLGVNAWLRIAHDRSTYRADAQRDHNAFGRGLAAAIEFVWARDGKEAALEAVEQFNRRESHLTVRWVWLRTPLEDAAFAARARPRLLRRGQRRGGDPAHAHLRAGQGGRRERGRDRALRIAGRRARGAEGDPVACRRDHLAAAAAVHRHYLRFRRALRGEPAATAGDLAKTVEQAVALVEPLAHQRKLQLALVATVSARLRMDAGQVHQALTNILVNALHATPEGGTVSVALRAQPDAFVIEVRDSGEGIPPEHIPHIFEPCFTTKRAGDGTGLGLSVADGIIRQHAGSIEVESAPEQGAVFRIRLPRAETS